MLGLNKLSESSLAASFRAVLVLLLSTGALQGPSIRTSKYALEVCGAYSDCTRSLYFCTLWCFAHPLPGDLSPKITGCS